MAKYVYPAIFTPEENGGYSVLFPDLEGCYTQGDDLPDALEMAKDVLELTLYDYETEKKSIPEPSNFKDMKAKKEEIISLVAGDTITYRKMYNTKAVKKTLTIPEWLNTQAEKANAPYSQILQQGLKQYLNII
jgi:predicted RNase H-like HicB family nuclease